MSRCVFSVPLFFLFLFMCFAWRPVCADHPTLPRNTLELFVPWETKLPEEVGMERPVVAVQNFQSPFLVAGDGVMVAFAAAYYIEGSSKHVDIAARFIETEGKGWVESVTESSGSNWETQLVLQKEKGEKEEGGDFVDTLRTPLAVIKNNKIYVLVVKCKRKKRSGYWEYQEWDFETAVGEIEPKNRAQGTDKAIYWEKSTSLTATLAEELKSQSFYVLPHGGSAFLTEDGRIVFVLRAFNHEGRDVSVIIHSKDTREVTGFDWSHVEAAQGCYIHSVFEWERNLVMVARCQGDNHYVRKSADMGVAWTDAVGPISRVWSTLKSSGDLTTAIIGNKKVLLFTQPKDTMEGSELTRKIYLWLTDGSRVRNVGPIFVDSINEVSSSGLLYTNGELFFLYQQWGEGPQSIFLLHLKDRLDTVRSVLKSWTERHDYLSQPCTEILCTTPMPTAGLVGFLSNSTSENKWHDEYLYVNAVVEKGTKVRNGFTFNGASAGAKWPVGQQGENKRYNFAIYGITIVATVAIHELPGSDSPLLTFGGAKNKERLGLWYSSDNKWKVMFKNGGTATGGSETSNVWQRNKAYRVALMLKNNKFSVYVDGKPVGSLFYVSASGEGLFDMHHLFISGYEDDNGDSTSTVGHVTVANVFLYNRLFSDTELEALVIEDN